jgi:hypothetical protein
MLTHSEFATIQFSPFADGASPRLNDPHGFVQLLEDTEESAPDVHWMVCLGGGESSPIDMSLFAEENADSFSNELCEAIA